MVSISLLRDFAREDCNIDTDGMTVYEVSEAVKKYLSDPCTKLSEASQKRLDIMKDAFGIKSPSGKSDWEQELKPDIIEKLADVGNVNGASIDEIKQAIYAASGIPASVIENNKELDELAQIHRERMTNAPKILDSGDRTEFKSGAVRDMRKGKGRCDLLPLDVVAEWIKKTAHDPYPERTESTYWIFTNIYRFQETGDITFLYHVLNCFVINYDYTTTMLLEVAKHFEEGAKKYGDNNWRKGIPSNVYIDSAVRHYLKYLRGDKDEPHDRAFCWNILCCIWTVKHIESVKED